MTLPPQEEDSIPSRVLARDEPSADIKNCDIHRTFSQEWQPFPESVIVENNDAFEYCQLTEDTFAIRSSSHTITVPREGFDILCNATDRHQWNDYLDRTGIISYLREDI